MQLHHRLKIFNFLFFGMLALFIPFLPVYLAERGLSPSEIGLVVGTGGFVTIITQPLWGFISDKTKTIRKILLLLLVVASLFGYFLFSVNDFVLLVIFAMLVYFFLMPIDPLMESLNFTVAEAAKISYGSIRTYGALGYALLSLVTGYIMSYFGNNSVGILFVVLGVLGILIILKMPDAPTSSKPVTIGGLKSFLSNKQTLAFLILVFICSVPARMNDTFLGVHIRTLGGSTELVGQAFFFAASSEIIVFALSFWWLRQGKEMLIITIAALFFFVRFFISAWITDPQMLVFVQLLQMLTFPIFYTAAIQYLYRIVPVEWRATGQTVLALLFFGVSSIIASYAGGFLYNALTGQQFYLVVSAISLAGTVFGLVLLVVNRSKKTVE
ncbi:MFS transporter [Viridibacillus sp. YIM B01967]|uniref:MFS transporter n=1 Tax=Viridibacillus soli TaxID=2798301 RepID=A0ABS1H6S4_9BACL|nr:MFS transporter [Viridibacillus soli]MBK3495090.1 MFS transporter [Viridibacillus soli]